MASDAPASTAELLAKLPPLPDVKRPFFQPEQVAKSVADGDTRSLEEMISGRFLDYMLTEILAELPDVEEHIASLGPAGLVLQARPSNTINALMIPTPDGVVIVYNLGLYSMLYSFSQAVSLALEQHDATQAVHWLSSLVDWATSRAKEPRTVEPIQLKEESSSLASNLASRAQRFAMCHELGHVITFDRAETADRSANVAGVPVSVLQDSWNKEYAADRDGLKMYLRVLASRGQTAASALIGAEVFLNAASTVQESSGEESQAHPPADERIARVRSDFEAECGDQASEQAGPSKTVRSISEALRNYVRQEVQRRRTATTAQFKKALESYAERAPDMAEEEYRAAAKRLSRFLLDSPGATLDCLHEVIFAPKGSDEQDGGSPARILAVNAALHLEKPLQEAIELHRRQLHYRGEP